MRQQLNKHRGYHEQIYETLKNQTNRQIPQFDSYCGQLQSNLAHHYQNELIRNAINQRRLQFRNFVASVSQQQIVDRERDQQKANLLLLGNLDKLQQQKKKLCHERARSNIQDERPTYTSDPKVSYKYDHILDAELTKSFREDYKPKRQPLGAIQNSQLINRAQLSDQNRSNGEQVIINKKKYQDQVNTPINGDNLDACLLNEQLAAKLRKIKSYRVPNHQIQHFEDKENAQQHIQIPLGLKGIKNIVTKKDQEYNEMLAETIRKKWLFDENDKIKTKEILSHKHEGHEMGKKGESGKQVNFKKNLQEDNIHFRSATEEKKQNNFHNFIKKMSSTQSLITNCRQNKKSSILNSKNQAIKIQQNLYLPSKDQSFNVQKQKNNKIKAKSPNQQRRNQIKQNYNGITSSRHGYSLKPSPKKNLEQAQKNGLSSAKNKKSNISQLRNKKLSNNYFSNLPDLKSYNPVQGHTKSNAGEKNSFNSSRIEGKTPKFTKSINSSVNLSKKSAEQEAPEWQKKIQRRLQLSQIIFIDSNYRNISHENQHLHNSYIKQEGERKEIRQKICKFVQQQRKTKKKKTPALYW